MNLKILASLLIIGVASAGVGYGTFAFFTSEVESLGNEFTAGTLVLDTDAPFNWAYPIDADLAPGDSFSGEIKLLNAGSIIGDRVWLDLRGNLGSGSSAFADMILITDFVYGSQTLSVSDVYPLATVDGNGDPVPAGDGRITLMDLIEGPAFIELVDPGATGTTLSLNLKFDEAADNSLQGQSMTLDFIFKLRQRADAAGALS